MTEQTFHSGGIAVYAHTNEHLHSFNLAVYVRTGSTFESSKNHGIAHFLEHAIFRNIQHKYGGKLYDYLSLHGLSFFGCTYKEFLFLCISGPPSGFSVACDIFCSIFDKLSLTVSQLTQEKERIKAEIRESCNRHSLNARFTKEIWGNTNGDKDILGTCRMLDRTSRKALEAYRRNVFSSNNCFVYVTGCATQSQLLHLTGRIAQLDIAQDSPLLRNIIHPTGSFFHRDGTVSVKDGYDYTVCMGFDVDCKKHSGGVLDLIYKILVDGDNALLFQHLSENDPLIYSYDSNFEQYDNVGCLTIQFEITADRLESSISRVVDSLSDLKQGRFHYEANLNYELARWALLQDNPEDLNWSLAYYNHILETDPIVYSSPLLGRFSTVTKEAIVASAREIFTRSNLTVLLEGRKKKIDSQRLESILLRLDTPE